ncbi:hypothetical protein LOD99_183 [Oopsacas minuta]|uniref:G-protein coupled receptors family 1 profile domain-containing protein n=1 Tax=Oopsacas minuta TaxID=111878 RepID=A0AAV7K879_9METZ|nr:hypothetical protein LOD99_183 [Oopsacas minuta]
MDLLCMNTTNAMNQTVLECSTRCNVSVFEGVERDVGKGFTLFIVGILGLIGNIFTIALIFSFKKRHVPDILVLSLAFNDIYSVLFPILIALVVYFYPLRLPQGHWSCELMTLLSLLSRIMSMFLHTLIAIDRFLAIARPLQYRRIIKPITAMIIIVVFFVISLLISLIPWIYDATLDAEDPSQCLQHQSISILNICIFDYAKWYSIIILVLGWGQMMLFFVVFVTTVTIALRYYYKRTRLLKGNDRILQESLNASSISRKDSKKETKILKHITKLGSKMKERKLTEWLWLEFSFEIQFVRMLFILSILFYLTWAPSLIIITYVLIGYWNTVSLRPDELIFWGIRISVLNIALNPIIYAIFSTQYRNAYWYAIKKYLFCCCKKYFSEDKISPFDRDERRRQKKHQYLSGMSNVSGELESDSPPQNFTRGAQAPGLATISENSLPKTTGGFISEDEKPFLPSYLSKKGRAIRFEDENSSCKTQDTQETSSSLVLPPLTPDDKRIKTGAFATEEGVSMLAIKRQIFEGFTVQPRQPLPKARGRMTKLLTEKPKHKTVRVKGESVLETSQQQKRKIHKTMPQIYASPYIEETDQLSPPKLDRLTSLRHKRPILNLK